MYTSFPDWRSAVVTNFPSGREEIVRRTVKRRAASSNRVNTEYSLMFGSGRLMSAPVFTTMYVDPLSRIPAWGTSPAPILTPGMRTKYGEPSLFVKKSRNNPLDGSVLTLEANVRSEEHTYELQSRLHLVCRLLLE